MADAELIFQPPDDSNGPPVKSGEDDEQNTWKTEGQLRVVADALPALIAYVDRQQRYCFNNSGYLDWFGQSPQELRGKHLREVLGDSAYAVIRPYVEAVLAGHTVSYERILPYKDAGDRYVAVRYIPHYTATGEVRGFFSVVSDITAMKQREERERQHLLELSHAARLTAMGEMATEIAHEINQPLTAIANYSMVCLRAVQTGQAAHQLIEWLEKINAQAKRANQLVYQLRAFVDKKQVAHTLVDMTELVREVLDFAAIEARTHGVKIRVKEDSKACHIVANQILIEQVLLNLIRNAIEALAAMDHGERQVYIHTTQQADMIVVAVSDNGPGILPELGERIFETFVTSKADGLGMGLTISRSIIEAHGGKLWVSSSLGEGATFTFTLPAAEER
jgi:PAS domain S-box-containing protein